MAESYSVKAILSAQDSGFSAAMKSASSAAGNLKSTLTSGLGFGILMGAGQQAFSAISGGIAGMTGELSSSSAAWKTFASNMVMTGKTQGEIKSIKQELRSFAEQTIYSSSDMASTFAQLEAVGTKNTTRLVKGFGGLAAAAENPKQAMKTLSTQATQMAAKPTVAWMDFKLMLEQTPAGISAVAKEMGMTTGELVKNVQNGSIATEDFFDSISKVGTNDAFTKLATEYKTVGQAMDGLQETMANKLQPAFDALSAIGIQSISRIVDKMGEINGDVVTGKIMSMVQTVTPYWQSFSGAVKDVASACGDAFGSIGDSLGEVLKKQSTIDTFKAAISGIAGVVEHVAGIIADNSDTIVAAIPYVAGLALAFKGFKIIKTVAPFVSTFTGAISKLAANGIGGIAAKLFGISKGQEAVGKSSRQSSKKMLTSAQAFVMLGAGVLLVSSGFALLAYSAVSLANAGPVAIGVMVGLVAAVAAFGAGMTVMLNSIKPGPAKLKAISIAMISMGTAVVLVATGFMMLTMSAINLAAAGPLVIGIMVGMVAAIAGLAVGASALGPSLTAGAVGFIAFGAAIALVGVGALLAATALTLIAGVLPIVVQYGATGAVAIMQLGLGMMVLAAGTAVAGAGCIILGAGLAVVAAGLVLVGAAVMIAAAGVLLLGAGALVLGAGLAIVAVSLTVVASALPLVAAGALASGVAFSTLLVSSTALSAVLLLIGATSLGASVGMAAFGVTILASSVGALAMAVALVAVNASMKSIASSAKTANSSLKSMVGAVDVVSSGLDTIGNKAKSAMDSLISKFTDASGKAKTEGINIGNNMRNGVQSGLNPLPSIAVMIMSGFNSGLQSGGAQSMAIASMMSSSIVSSLRSASSGAYRCGYYIGQGLANGMSATLGMVRSVATQLAAAAEAAVVAKAKIGSPSRVFHQLGEFVGEGFSNGIDNMQGSVRDSAKNLVAIPSLGTIPSPELTFNRFASGADGSLSEEYTYHNGATYTIIVPVDLEGREIAKVIAPYTQEELEKLASRNSRKRGNR